jgi:hypothetical protein
MNSWWRISKNPDGENVKRTGGTIPGSRLKLFCDQIRPDETVNVGLFVHHLTGANGIVQVEDKVGDGLGEAFVRAFRHYGVGWFAETNKRRSGAKCAHRVHDW